MWTNHAKVGTRWWKLFSEVKTIDKGISNINTTLSKAVGKHKKKIFSKHNAKWNIKESK